MRIKRQPGVLELLITFVDDYMPTAAGLSANTIRLYKASFRLLLTYFYNVKEISADKIIYRCRIVLRHRYSEYSHEKGCIYAQNIFFQGGSLRFAACPGHKLCDWTA